MSDVKQHLSAIAANPDQKQKADQYKQALQHIFSSASVDGATAFLEHMLSDEVPLVVSRQVLQYFAVELAKLPPDALKPIATFALERIQPRVVSFEEQVTLLRENYAKVLEAEEEWTKAAQILGGIDLDSGMRNIEPQYKLATNIKIAMLYLEDDDTVNAELFIKKASSLIGSCKDEELELQYKVCYARILDSKRRFSEAALRYYELSSLQRRQIGSKTVAEEELITALRAAIYCTILAPAGPQRSRMLSTLYKDERSAALPVYGFLEKVYMERILRKDEVDAFAQELKPHQMALLPDGSTVLQRAVMQHNLSAASKLYNNICIPQLGELLGVDEAKAESIAADMISEGRMPGSIDQVERMISFDNRLEPLIQWDQQIMNVCQAVNDIIDHMVQLGIKVDA